MYKIALISALLLFSSCTWLMQHPQIEADLKQEGKDITRDTAKTIDDLIDIADQAPQDAATK